MLKCTQWSSSSTRGYLCRIILFVHWWWGSRWAFISPKFKVSGSWFSAPVTRQLTTTKYRTIFLYFAGWPSFGQRSLEWDLLNSISCTVFSLTKKHVYMHHISAMMFTNRSSPHPPPLCRKTNPRLDGMDPKESFVVVSQTISWVSQKRLSSWGGNLPIY